MAAVDDLDEVVEQYHLALGEFLKGDPQPLQMMYSHREDVTLANPFGLPRVDGGRLLRLWSVPRRITEMARSSALRT
jgi:hypothetical protein